MNASTVLSSRRRRDELTATLLREWPSTAERDHEKAVKELVEINMPVARTLARHYTGRGISAADLEQVAFMGLTAAARRFDPERGDNFLAFAVPTIRGELRRAFRDSGWVVRPPRRLQELQSKMWVAESELWQTLHRSPTPQEIARHLDADEDDVIEALTMDGCYSPTSLDQPMGEGESASLADAQGRLDPAFDTSEARLTLAPAMKRLGPRDRRIVELRFFHGWTQKQIGEEIGVTQMQVSRLLTRILADLRRGIEGEETEHLLSA